MEQSLLDPSDYVMLTINSFDIIIFSQIARIPMKQENVRIVVEDASVAPLPIERMFVNLPTNPEDGKVICQFCQYFLHYLQVEISDIKNEVSVRYE